MKAYPQPAAVFAEAPAGTIVDVGYDEALGYGRLDPKRFNPLGPVYRFGGSSCGPGGSGWPAGSTTGGPHGAAHPCAGSRGRSASTDRRLEPGPHSLQIAPEPSA